jgi:hypothetical protein
MAKSLGRLLSRITNSAYLHVTGRIRGFTYQLSRFNIRNASRRLHLELDSGFGHNTLKPVTLTQIPYQSLHSPMLNGDTVSRGASC